MRGRGRGTESERGVQILRGPSAIVISAELVRMAQALLSPDYRAEAIKAIEEDQKRYAAGEMFPKPKYIENRDKIVEGALEGFEQELARIQHNPEEIRRLLETQARLHSYSINNSYWIMIQNPDASRVANKTDWKKKGRLIKKDENGKPEKGMFILRPLMFPASEIDPITKKKKPLYTLDPKTGKKKRVYKMARGPKPFQAVDSAYDISQTEPDPEAKKVWEEQELAHADVIAGLHKFANSEEVSVAVAGEANSKPEWNRMMASQGAVGGFYSREEKAIVLAPESTPVQRIRVLAHELAHHALGHGRYEDDQDRQVKELEAESVAYAVCNYFNVETPMSAGYVAHWAKGQTTARFRESLQRIQRATKAILTTIEGEK